MSSRLRAVVVSRLKGLGRWLPSQTIRASLNSFGISLEERSSDGNNSVEISREEPKQAWFYTGKDAKEPTSGLGKFGLVAELVQKNKGTNGNFRPCLSLGGLSPMAFSLIYGTNVNDFVKTANASSSEMINRLVDQNEFLEDTHSYMASFIEHQKDRIQTLEEEVSSLRLQLGQL